MIDDITKIHGLTPGQEAALIVNIRRAVAAEREACARIADHWRFEAEQTASATVEYSLMQSAKGGAEAADRIAKAIRKRSMGLWMK